MLAPADQRQSQRLCVLGAGNCNDLDLTRLADMYREVHLVDLDQAALEFGVQRQGVSSRGEIRVQGGVDLTGIAADLARWSPENNAGDQEVLPRAERAACAPAPELAQPFDVVASVCLLTQLIDSVRHAIGEGHPRFVDLAFAVRNRHLRMLIELVCPGGTLVLITDIVSSLTCPQLTTVPQADLPQLVTRLVRTRNFFTGVNPFVLGHFFRTDAAISSEIAGVELSAPWLWDFGPRTYVVCAVRARRKR